METLNIKDMQNIPVEELSIDEARAEIDRLDDEILVAIRRRTALSQSVGRARLATGGTKLVHSREMSVIEHYAELGAEGRNIALSVLKLGRGVLGRR